VRVRARALSLCLSPSLPQGVSDKGIVPNNTEYDDVTRSMMMQQLSMCDGVSFLTH